MRKSRINPCPVITAIALLACAGMLFPVSSQQSDPGTVMFDFLDINYDGRSAGLAGASVALPSESYGILSNPAALAFIEENQITLGTRSEGGGIYGAPILFVMPKADLGVFGAGIIGLLSGAVSGRDENNNPVADSRADYYAGHVSYARMINANSSAGLTLKGLYNYLGNSQEHYSADGFALDGGVQYRFLDSRLIYGLVVRNLGFVRSGYTPDIAYAMPTAVGIGVSYVPRDLKTIRLVLDMEKQKAQFLNVMPGLELELARNQMLLRVGYGFTSRDMEAMIKSLQGKEELNYYKSNRYTLCLGTGFITRMFERKVNLDAAVAFAGSGLYPSMILSMIMNL